MTEEHISSEHGNEERIESRAHRLLPEERKAGSADPHAQAYEILAESDQREAEAVAADLGRAG